MRVLLIVLFLTSSFASAKPSTLADLQKQLKVTEQSIEVTRQKIKENRNIQALPDIYMTLADFQLQKASLSFAIKREKNPKSPIEELDTTQEKRLKEEAIETYSLVSTRFLTYRDLDKTLYFLAQTYSELGQADKALQSYKKLTDQFSKSSLWEAAQFAIGNYYFEKKDFAFAMEQFQKVLDRPENPYTALAHFRIGWCYINQAKWKLSFDQFEKIFNSKSDIKSAALPDVKGQTDIKEEALIASVWPYLELTSTETAKRTDLVDPTIYYQERSPNERVYHKVLQRLANRLTLKKRYRDAARSLYLSLQLTTSAEDKLPTLEEFFLLNRDQKLSIWPKDYAQQIQATLENADLKTKNKYEPMVRDVATQLHTTALATKRTEDLEQVIEAYEVYFFLYPKNSTSEEMRVNLAEALFLNKDYIQAAKEYTKVYVRTKKDNKTYINSALQAYMEGLKQSDKLSRLDRLQAQHGFRKLGAVFVRNYPNDPTVSAVDFNLAKLEFDGREFNNARELLRQFLAKYPNKEETEQAALLLLDSYYQENDLKKLSDEGQKLLSMSSLSPKIKVSIKELVEQSKLKTVRNLAGDFGSKEYSQNLLKFALNSKDGSLNEPALYEAFLSAKSRKDPKTYSIAETYIAKFPNSDKSKAINLELIQMALRSADFRLAGRYLEVYATRYPNDPETKTYLAQAEMIYSKLQSIEDLKRIVSRTGNNEELNRVLFEQKRWNELAKEASQLKGLSGSYYQGIALYRRGDLQTSVGLLNRAADGNPTSADEKANAAHASFIVAQVEFEKLKEKMQPGVLSPALLKSTVNEVQSLENSLRRVLNLQQGRWVVGSLYLLGKAQLELAKFFQNGQPPQGLTSEQLQKALAPQIQKAQEQAKEYFVQCKQIATEQKILTQFLRGCLQPTQNVNEKDEFLTMSPNQLANDSQLASLRITIANQSKDDKAWMRLAEKLFRERAYADAYLVLSQLVENVPESAEGWAALGVMQLHVGKIDSSVDSFKRALSLNAGQPLADYAMKKLENRFSIQSGRQIAGRRPSGVWTHPYLE